MLPFISQEEWKEYAIRFGEEVWDDHGLEAKMPTYPMESGYYLLVVCDEEAVSFEEEYNEGEEGSEPVVVEGAFMRYILSTFYSKESFERVHGCHATQWVRIGDDTIDPELVKYMLTALLAKHLKLDSEWLHGWPH